MNPTHQTPRAWVASLLALGVLLASFAVPVFGQRPGTIPRSTPPQPAPLLNLATITSTPSPTRFMTRTVLPPGVPAAGHWIGYTSAWKNALSLDVTASQVTGFTFVQTVTMLPGEPGAFCVQDITLQLDPGSLNGMEFTLTGDHVTVSGLFDYPDRVVGTIAFQDYPLSAPGCTPQTMTRTLKWTAHLP